MKKVTKYILIMILVVAALGSAALGSAALAFAQDNPPPRGPRGGGVGGEVTAVGESSLTVKTRNEESVVVNVTSETSIRLAETRSEGSLSDIEVGNGVRVRGTKNEDGSVEAQTIFVVADPSQLPQKGNRPPKDGMPEGDRAGGRVTGVAGETITVEARDGSEATIITNDTTVFRVGHDQEGSLSDVTEGKFVGAVGEKQEDGSLVATHVHISDGQGKPGRGPGSDE